MNSIKVFLETGFNFAIVSISLYIIIFLTILFIRKRFLNYDPETNEAHFWLIFNFAFSNLIALGIPLTFITNW